MSLRQNLRQFFEQHPDRWIDGKRLAKVAGAYAWRSRVAELRTKDDMDIENRVTREGEFVVSEYRYHSTPRFLEVCA